MRASFPRRKIATVFGRQLEEDDVVCHVLPLGHDDRKDRRRGIFIRLRRHKPVSVTLRQPRLVGRWCQHVAIALDPGVPVQRLHHGIGTRHDIGGIDSQRLIFVLQVDFRRQFSTIGGLGGDVAALRRIKLDVPPPRLHGIDPATTKLVIKLRQSTSAAWHIHGHPSEPVVGNKAFKVPRARLHAAPAHAACRVGQTVPCALFGIRFPDLIAVVH